MANKQNKNFKTHKIHQRENLNCPKTKKNQSLVKKKFLR